jgi:molybdopterin-guanine dinucleotide biosynthesis protein A
MTGRGRLGAVLAGGRSSRFGSDKRQARFRGETLLFRSVRMLSAVCDEVVVVGGGRELRILIAEAFPVAAPSSDPDSKWIAVPDVIPDRHRGIGPLGGLHSALVAAREREMAGVIVLGCDMPLVTSGLLSVIARAGEATDRMAAAIPRNTRPDDAASETMRFHPLCAWYSSDSLHLVESRIMGPDHSLQGLLHELDPYRIPGPALAGIRNPELMLRSANTPEELRALEEAG